jgi:hypothetical protein
MANSSPDFWAILQTLCDHQVDFIVVGGVCAVLHGAPLVTMDLDIVHSRTPENLDRLLSALQELGAYYRELPARRLSPTHSHLASPGHQLLHTKAGSLDLLGTLNPGQGYEELLDKTVLFQVREGLTLRLLNLETLIALKEAAARDKDKAVLPILKRTLEERGKA